MVYSGAMWTSTVKTAPLGVTLVITVILEFVSSWPLDMEAFTDVEFVAVDKLRLQVAKSLTTEDMEDDTYLAKWLSATDYNIDKAAELLVENVKWRKEHKLDTILEEDWTYMERQFPYDLDSKDVLGRPILYFFFGKWNIHKLMTEEDSLVTLGRYMMKVVEESDQYVRTHRHAEQSMVSSNIIDRRNARNHISQFSIIINFDGYDIWNQGCFQCLAFYRGFGQTLEAHFPRAVERVALVNVPTPFEVVYWYVEALWSEKTRLSVTLYTTDRSIWEPALLTWIRRDQLPPDLLVPKGDEYITTREVQTKQQI